MARTGLGKGLGALIGTPSVATPTDAAVSGERVHRINLASIAPSALQPRKDFGREALQELIDSIRQHGIIQPLIVRQVGARFELIAGERRWRAAQEIGLTEVPAIIRSASDLEVLELSLIENLQRADLNPIEEAQGYARLANEFGMRQEDIALKVGRSRVAVANALRLLDLHPQVQVWLAQDLISVGHAKVLLALKVPEEQLLAAETVLRRNAPCVLPSGWLPACLESGVHVESPGARGVSRAFCQRQWKICRTGCKNTSLRTSPSIMETNEAGLKSSTTETTIFSGL
jgi:ParB family chromosome partitioning protein